MSQNFFAALDDSGDEAPSPAKATTNTKKRDPKPPKAVADTSSKPDNRRNTKQNNHDKHDRNTKYGRGGGRGHPRDGKRQYDRRSGTGRGREIKKGGGGARNWGNEKDDAKKREGKIDEDKIDDTEPKEETTERAEGDENPNAAEGEPEPEPKPEDNTLTFEEYMAAKGQKEEVQLREVENEFKGKSAAKKVEEDFLVMGGGKQKKGKKKNAGEKQKVEVGFRTAPSDTGGGGYRDGGRGRGGRGRSDRGGRGGRGGRDGRGRGGRGGRGRGSSKNYVPNVQDTNAFPSL